MNDPNKRIDIDKSSLLSLKAELLRKQAEISKAKSYNSVKDFVPKRITKTEKEKPKLLKDAKNLPTRKSLEVEDTALLMKSKRMLQRKAKYYDKMTSGGGSLNSDENCLVMFNQKHQDDRISSNYHESSSDDSDIDNSQYYSTNDPEEEWVEYTDCLGRTRKCLKKDVEDFQKRDKDLSKEVDLRNIDNPTDGITQEIENGEILDSETTENDATDTVIGPEPVGTRFRQMLDKWDDQELKNMEKESVHYQDILFDEARTHGVGFYEFSTDEQERAKQQKELESIRKATLEAQKSREELRKNRDKIIADRVKAAKARQRARLGLPPEEDAPPTEEDLYDKTEEMKRKAQEDEDKRVREMDEAKRETERQQHVRPWDKGKSKAKHNFDANTDEEGDADDVEKEWKPRIPKEPLTQTQWNEKQREVRNGEFAPIPENAMLRKTALSRVAPPASYTSVQFDCTKPPPPLPQEFDVDDLPEEPNRSLFFTTKKKTARKIYSFTDQPSSYAASDGNAPRSCSPSHDSDDGDDLRPPGTEIPPPATFDYYGPNTSKHRKRMKPNSTDLEKSIEAGLQFLRKQSDKNQTKKK